MKETFIDWNPTGKSAKLVQDMNAILSEYSRQGYRLTLRQLYYQLVARDLVPNTVRSYKNVGDKVNKARLAGMMDWRMIEDRVRIPAMRSHWDSPAQITRAAADSYYRDRWATQPEHVEVWCEKDAVANILEPACRALDVTFMANRGYSSQSAMYEASKRFLRAQDQGKPCIVFYLGDHDPSGIDMTRDIRDRLDMFSFGVEVVRLALNMDQVERYGPPENPAKVTDSRFDGYVAEFGESSWELDALEPSVLRQLVDEAIRDRIDDFEWSQVEALEESHKDLLSEAADRMDLETRGDL